MPECKECGQPFVKKPKAYRQFFCSPYCHARSWRRKNKNEYNTYMRDYRADNAADLNTKRKNGWPAKKCLVCEAVFFPRSSRGKFCSLKCSYKATRAKPEQKEKHYHYQKNWRAQNKERNNIYHRAFYKRNARRKLTLNPWKSIFLSTKERAKRFNRVFELDETWMEAHWSGACELTKISFASPAERVGYKNRNFSPSIDRIDSAKGYTKENSRIVLWAVNSFKRDGTDADMYRIAKALIENCPSSGSAVGIDGAANSRSVAIGL